MVHTDHFGNLVTNITAEDLGQFGSISVEIKGRIIPGLSKTFHDDGSDPEAMLVALISSSGYLEIAVRDSSAAQYLSAGVADPVTARTTSPASPS